MTLNILFLTITITITKRKKSLKNACKEERMDKLQAENKDRRFYMRHF